MKMTSSKNESVRNVELDSFAEKEYVIYGISVNEDRAIPSGIDGLKPVARRLIWAAHKIGATREKKSARIVGDTIGKFHPHGDAAAYEALVNMINSPMPTFDGVGNFGTFSDTTYAASRYTNAKLSKYSEKIFLDSFYSNTIETVPNYDGEEIEPCLLPSLLPNLFLNGTSGIGVGLATSIPAFSKDSVVQLLKEVMSGKELTYKLCAAKLKFITKYGATYDKVAFKKEIESIIKEGRGRIIFKPVMKTNIKAGTITVTGFAQLSMEKTLEKLLPLKNKLVKNASDISGTEDKNGTLLIELTPMARKDFEGSVSKIETLLSAATTFDIKVTDRVLNKDEVKVTLRNTSVVELLKDWIEYRINLEIKACDYWITHTDTRIHYHEILRLAVANLDKVVKALKEKHASLAELNTRVSKLLGITEKEAAIITDLKVYRLSAMEDEKLVKTIKELQEKKKTLKGRKTKPAEHIAGTLEALIK